MDAGAQFVGDESANWALGAAKTREASDDAHCKVWPQARPFAFAIFGVGSGGLVLCPVRWRT
jgi:hypothetical protein